MKKLISFILVIVMMLTVMTTVFATDTGDDPTTWKQYDSRWGSLTLGESGSMGSWGCLVTSIAIQMARADVVDDDFNPGILRDKLEAGGFVSHASTVASDGNLSYGSAFSKSNSPDFYYAGSKDWTYTSFSKIRETISDLQNDGYYVVARVKHGGHWVACGPVSDSDVRVYDPGYNVTSLRAYDGGIMGCVYFKANTETKTGRGVVNTSGITLSGANSPSCIKEGSVFCLEGIISSENPIKHVVVGVYNSRDKWMTGKISMNVNDTTYNIKTLADASVRFDLLPKEEYTYRVSVITETEKRVILLETFFQVT